MAQFRLQKFRPEDSAFFEKLIGNQAIMEMNYGRLFSPEESAMLWQAILTINDSDGPAGYYQVYLTDEPMPIGMFGLSPQEKACAEIEYMLLPEYRGKGLATRLVAEQLKELPASVTCINAIVDPNNLASIRVLEHNGFVFSRNIYSPEAGSAGVYSRILSK